MRYLLNRIKVRTFPSSGFFIHSKIVILEHVCHRIQIVQLPNFNCPIFLSLFVSNRTLLDTRVLYKLPLLQKKNFITGKQMQLSSPPPIAYTT